MDFCDTLAAILKKAKKEQIGNRLPYGELYSIYYYTEVWEKDRVYYEVYTLPEWQRCQRGIGNFPLPAGCFWPDGTIETQGTVSIMCCQAKKRIAGLEDFHFHMLRHIFSTASLEHGMDVKTLSTIIGHVSSSTTLNVYAHVTDEMRRTAAVKIDQGIGRAEPQAEIETAPRKPAPSTFHPHKSQRRKAGTGCVSQITDTLWEGRYFPIWPDGKKHPRNIYAHSEEECEKLLAGMIVVMKAEIAAEKERLRGNAKTS